MDRIRELLGRLAELNAEELEELRGLVLAEADRLEDEPTTPENVALLNELAEAGEQVVAEAGAREAAQAQAEADAQAARERIAVVRGGNDDEEGTPEADDETPAVDEVEETPEAVAASAGSAVGRMAARSGAPAPSPEAEPAANRAVLVATGHLRGVDPNQPIQDPDAFAEALAETLTRMPRDGAGRGDVVVASARYHYPEDRRLGRDPYENTRLMEAASGPQALLASGGICAPTNVDYAISTWASADRPLREALPGYEASRGGLRYVLPPDIGALAGATGLWTAATDANPGSATKPIIQVACGAEVQTYVEAVSTRLGFGNMQSRFAPEQVAANTDLAIAAAARIAENNLLNLIAAACTAGVTSATVLGATRDLLTVINQVVAGYRSLHRIPRSQAITAIFPDWLKDLLRVDLAREIGHAQTSEWNSLTVSDQQIVDLLRASGINPVFHLDGQPSSVAGGVAQTFAVQGASGAVNAFPTKLVWYVYAEGMFQFLDAGRLDLGVVRDSTLDATNDYETFVETFEGIAYRGFTGGALQMVSTLCANGGSAGTISTASACA